MRAFLLRQSSAIVPMLLVLVIVFFVLRLSGDPALVALGDAASRESLAAFREANGLDRPLIVQFGDFVGGLLRGDLGTSLISGRSVGEQIARALPFTIELTLAALLFGILVGMPLGILAAVRQNRVTDYVIRIASLTGLSFPAFFLAIVLILVFALGLNAFPVISSGGDGSLGDRLHHLVLPAISAGLVIMAYITRATRAALLEVLDADFMRTAHAKGLAPARVVLRHGLRNAILPVITVIGLQFGLLIGNTVLIEIVFNRPGLGKLIVAALNQRDYQMMQALMVIYALIVTTISVVTDLAYSLADPRIRLT